MSTISSIIYSSFIIGTSVVIFAITQVVPEADVVTIESNLEVFLFAQAAFACLILLLEKPKYAPSAVEVQAAQKRNSLPFWESVRRTLNKNYVLVLIAATLSSALMAAYQNIRNQIFTQFFLHKVSVLGTMMLVSSIFSALSLIVFGFLFDKYKCHKSVCIASIVALGVINATYYFGLVYESIEIVFLTHVLGSIMTTGLFGLNYSAPEINYPLPESISVTMFSIFEQVGSSLFTFTMTSIINAFGTFAVYAFMTSMFVIAIIAICCTKIELKRTNAQVALSKATEETEHMENE
ncbi:hypothetical protein B4U80_14147 [Leptotrombidium deliense]|uniref:Feline leukemia virus subgroup C receptor-related protein 2-like protein n=1 Tax=Leptotrombidium deliense TaxID=299467 RepID=A0A443S1K2_9ACAR|nr:hypothetical protein B4U80_14147 [Leptotrombidium deliense]